MKSKRAKGKKKFKYEILQEKGCLIKQYKLIQDKCQKQPKEKSNVFCLKARCELKLSTNMLEGDLINRIMVKFAFCSYW